MRPRFEQTDDGYLVDTETGEALPVPDAFTEAARRVQQAIAEALWTSHYVRHGVPRA